jgi:hypothetical protein
VAKRTIKLAPTKRPKSDDITHLLRDPKAAADQIDAILYFLHKRYSGESPPQKDLPTMRTFLISSMNVVFTDAVKQITIEKRMDQSGLSILAPSPGKSEEEARRIYLLNEFGDLLIKCQKQGLEQLREMLLGILDDDGKEQLVAEYLKSRRQLTTKK